MKDSYWRDVTHIEDKVGGRGGHYWDLMLTCGHLASKRKPRFDPARHIMFPPTWTAPKKLICTVCRFMDQLKEQRMNERKGDWMQTIGGRQFWPLDPKPHDFKIEEIAHALSNLCRFNGHCKKFYSVAEHSVYVSIACDPAYALEGLLHDATEAFLGDMIRPLKVNMPEYREAEERMECALAVAFDLHHPWPESVKKADERVLRAEARDILAPAPKPWGNPQGMPAEPFEHPIQCWAPNEAFRNFMFRYMEVSRGRERR